MSYDSSPSPLAPSSSGNNVSDNEPCGLNENDIEVLQTESGLGAIDYCAVTMKSELIKAIKEVSIPNLLINNILKLDVMLTKMDQQLP